MWKRYLDEEDVYIQISPPEAFHAAWLWLDTNTSFVTADPYRLEVIDTTFRGGRRIGLAKGDARLTEQAFGSSSRWHMAGALCAVDGDVNAEEKRYQRELGLRD